MPLKKVIVVAIVIILTVGYGYSFVKLFPYFLEKENYTMNTKAFVLGVAIYLPLFYFFLDFWKNWAGIFIHESIHAFACFFTFSKLSKFFIIRGNVGAVSCNGRNLFIALSPYFLPLTSLIPVILMPFFQHKYIPYLFIILGFTTAFHVSIILIQTRPHQPDLKVAGVFCSYVFIIFGNIMFIGLALSLTQHGFPGTLDYLTSGYKNIYAWVSPLWADLPITLTTE